MALPTARGLVLSAPEAIETGIHQQLEPVLPFAKYHLLDVCPPDLANTQLTEGTRATEGAQPMQLTKLPVHIGTNLYCADRTTMFPEMGAASAALLAWTLVENLGCKAEN